MRPMPVRSLNPSIVTYFALLISNDLNQWRTEGCLYEMYMHKLHVRSAIPALSAEYAEFTVTGAALMK